MFGLFSSNKKKKEITNSFASILHDIKKLNTLLEKEEYDDYLTGISECIDELKELVEEAKTIRPLYKMILSEISKLSYKQQLALAKHNQVNASQPNAENPNFTIWKNK